MNKDFRLKLKSLEDDGTFEGYAAVFGNVDLDGDRIDPAAFNRTLKNFRGEVPILWDHNTSSPAGVSIDLVPDAHGLRLKGRLLLSTAMGREAYEYLKARVIKGLSIGAQIVRSDWENGVRVLKELRLHEISLVAIPSNPLAEVVAVKHCEGCDHAHPADDESAEEREAETKALPLEAPAATESDSGQAHSLTPAQRIRLAYALAGAFGTRKEDSQ